MLSIFDYSQYREFLKDYYRDQKSRRTGFTYARFAEKARLGSPNYYKLVMDGEKGLTSANIIRFAKGLALSDEESDYFEALVNFNQASEPLEREFYQERINRLKKRKNLGGLNQKTLEEYEFESVSNWLYAAIMVLTHVKGFRESPVWIRRRLYNLVTEEEIVQVMDRLLLIGLLERDENGKLRQTHRHVRTKPDLRRQAARLFYEGLFGRASQAMRWDEPDSRELGALILGLSRKQLPELRKRVREFMKSLNDWAMENPSPEQVYTFLFAGVPLTSQEEKEIQWN